VEFIPQSGKYVGKIGRITLTDQISGFLLPTAVNIPQILTTGPDGALWFTESGSNGMSSEIGRLT
jgi:virginiamycin B lyase